MGSVWDEDSHISLGGEDLRNKMLKENCQVIMRVYYIIKILNRLIRRKKKRQEH